MKAALSAFKRPSSYTDILTYINITWENQLSYLEVIKKDQRDKIAEESLQYLTQLMKNASHDNLSNLIVGCGLLFRHFLSDLSPLFPLSPLLLHPAIDNKETTAKSTAIILANFFIVFSLYKIGYKIVHSLVGISSPNKCRSSTPDTSVEHSPSQPFSWFTPE